MVGGGPSAPFPSNALSVCGIGCVPLSTPLKSVIMMTVFSHLNKELPTPTYPTPQRHPTLHTTPLFPRIKRTFDVLVQGPVSKWSLRQDLLLKLRHVNDSSSRFLSLSSKSCLKLHLETGPRIPSKIYELDIMFLGVVMHSCHTA